MDLMKKMDAFDRVQWIVIGLAAAYCVFVLAVAYCVFVKS
jgi:uncharacterized membrane protein YuzA (DUF378 family)